MREKKTSLNKKNSFQKMTIAEALRLSYSRGNEKR